MTVTDTSAPQPLQTSAPPRLGHRATVRVILGNKTDRNMAFAGVSIPGHLGMAITKGALLFVAPSLMLLSNAVFTLGVATAKFLAVRSHRTARTGMAGLSASEIRAFQLRSYRMIAVLILGLSLAYVLSSVPLVLGVATSDRYDYAVALGIALLTFVELTMAICGAIVARRNKELLVEAVRLTSMAGSLILLVLTQTAIMSFAYEGDASAYNGLSGIILGSCAALIGVYMLARAWWLARRVGD